MGSRASAGIAGAERQGTLSVVKGRAKALPLHHISALNKFLSKFMISSLSAFSAAASLIPESCSSFFIRHTAGILSAFPVVRISITFHHPSGTGKQYSFRYSTHVTSAWLSKLSLVWNIWQSFWQHKFFLILNCIHTRLRIVQLHF
mgnify:CR=1